MINGSKGTWYSININQPPDISATFFWFIYDLLSSFLLSHLVLQGNVSEYNKMLVSKADGNVIFSIQLLSYLSTDILLTCAISYRQLKRFLLHIGNYMRYVSWAVHLICCNIQYTVQSYDSFDKSYVVHIRLSYIEAHLYKNTCWQLHIFRRQLVHVLAWNKNNQLCKSVKIWRKCEGPSSMIYDNDTDLPVGTW